jgi:hypothetical protein
MAFNFELQLVAHALQVLARDLALHDRHEDFIVGTDEVLDLVYNLNRFLFNGKRLLVDEYRVVGEHLEHVIVFFRHLKVDVAEALNLKD